MIDITISNLEQIRRSSPLIHNITNFVVMNSSANILLSIGASPVMAHCIEEVEEMANIASALVLNIGTLTPDWIDSMILAGKTANKKGIPVILDPVGSGATKLRTQSVKKILEQVKVSVLRGNASEIFSLFNADVKTKGVDSSLELSPQIIQAAKQMAKDLDLVIAISGKIDCITDGKQLYSIANGHPIMTQVTGIGCGLTAVVGAFCAVSADDILKATSSAFAFYALCGEIAEKQSKGPGSFFPNFVDKLNNIDDETLKTKLKISQ